MSQWWLSCSEAVEVAYASGTKLQRQAIYKERCQNSILKLAFAILKGSAIWIMKF